jgi:hypothetical protein
VLICPGEIGVRVGTAWLKEKRSLLEAMIRAAAEGAVVAMAITGMRVVTSDLGRSRVKYRWADLAPTLSPVPWFGASSIRRATPRTRTSQR